ncbi:MAG: Smr/MutS family protein [Candidatus Omnitrophota bacterium]
MKLKLNVYPVIPDMEEEIEKIIREAVDNRAKMVEIAYGPASDIVKKRILSVLNRKDVRKLYSRLEKTEKGWGRIYLYFRW